MVVPFGMELDDQQYLSLLDWTGRQLRSPNQGSIPPDLAPILERLGVVDSQWVELVREFGRWFRRAAGRPESLRQLAALQNQKWIRGIGRSRQVFVDREQSTAAVH